jgi:hypothetical protein
VLPVVCIASGIVLISHTHLVGDAHAAFFMEVSHLAMGLMSLVIGWARWLELRLPDPEPPHTRAGLGASARDVRGAAGPLSRDLTDHDRLGYTTFGSRGVGPSAP